MINKVKVHGAGSIGNHLAQASRRMGWEVDICDIDSKALYRTKEEILSIKPGSILNNVGLGKNITSQRTNGFVGAVNKIKLEL